MREDNDNNLRAARAMTSWACAGFLLYIAVLLVALVLGAWSRGARAAPVAIVTTRSYADSTGEAIRVQAFRYTGGVFRFTVDGDGIFRTGFEVSKK